MTSIGWHAFYGCTGLTRLFIPNSVTSSEEMAFPETTVIFGYNDSFIRKVASMNVCPYRIIGDINNDGSVKPDDARLALRTAVALEPTVTRDTVAFTAADYNRDGNVKPDDARAVLRVSVKLDPQG